MIWWTRGRVRASSRILHSARWSWTPGTTVRPSILVACLRALLVGRICWDRRKIHRRSSCLGAIIFGGFIVRWHWGPKRTSSCRLLFVFTLVLSLRICGCPVLPVVRRLTPWYRWVLFVPMIPRTVFWRRCWPILTFFVHTISRLQVRDRPLHPPLHHHPIHPLRHFLFPGWLQPDYCRACCFPPRSRTLSHRPVLPEQVLSISSEVPVSRNRSSSKRTAVSFPGWASIHWPYRGTRWLWGSCPPYRSITLPNGTDFAFRGTLLPAGAWMLCRNFKKPFRRIFHWSSIDRPVWRDASLRRYGQLLKIFCGIRFTRLSIFSYISWAHRDSCPGTPLWSALWCWSRTRSKLIFWWPRLRIYWLKPCDRGPGCRCGRSISWLGRNTPSRTFSGLAVSIDFCRWQWR